ncbi:hypothetical protein J3R82DRAFT_11307 [Butyriboletus roseoflavus]|nr:hypothetical protein J3R82DRAFT_11307 [Butyriboletus roseoflavus]
MCTFAIVRFVRESLQMYRVTKQWYPNRYMNLLVKEGILYFFAILLFNLIDVLTYAEVIPVETWQMIMLVFAEYVPMYALTPRFITSMRELYARDVQGKRGGGIDTAFGLSLSGHDAGGTAIVFADVGQTEGSEDFEEIPMEMMKTGLTDPN